MRYLNKIIFINSASVKYAEIELDGNVHLIGTQGVGKSTLLRAILFFYNGNKTKLGIPREKKSFDDYYFEYQNSYIIYEVIKDEVPFCVLAYKVNGKVAFRFFNSRYETSLFIDENNRAFENWEKIRNAFGKHIHYTSIVSSYEDFRRIIYGDNNGLNPEFRKYALIESKQYQNIPRTIQNVFLNANLEAKFIKDTIINSINEEEFTIDVENYSKSHLRDFETQINDITSWFVKNKKGKLIVRNQAEKVIDKLRVYNLLNRDRKELAYSLAARMDYIEKEKPSIVLYYSKEHFELNSLFKKIENLKHLHIKREQKIISDIDYHKKELLKASDKQTEYNNQNITELIRKVSQKNNLVSEQKILAQEKNLLKSSFGEISQKFEALISQVQNQQIEFANNQTAEINKVNSEFSGSKNSIFLSYQKLIAKIKEDNKGEKENAFNSINAITENENKLKRAKSEQKHKIYFLEELEKCNSVKKDLDVNILNLEALIRESNGQVSLVRKEWELAATEIERITEIAIDRKKETRAHYSTKYEQIESKIQNSKSSFYGWLNENVPNWENTIGKVADEDTVLFNTELNPKFTDTKSSTLFGIDLNLNTLQNRVKTVKEYTAEIEDYKNKISKIDEEVQKLIADKESNLQTIKSKFKKKLNDFKNDIAESEYSMIQNLEKSKKNKIELNEWTEKSTLEKQIILQRLENELDEIVTNKLAAIVSLENIRKGINRKIVAKERERDSEILIIENLANNRIATITTSILDNKKVSEKRITELNSQQLSELDNKGADTKRLTTIDLKLSDIEKLLEFISNNERIVFEFEKDKRELFDKVPEIKAEKLSLEKRQNSIVEEHKIETAKLNDKLHAQKDIVKNIQLQIAEFEADENKFIEFKKSGTFTIIEVYFSEVIKDYKDSNAIKIISELNDKHYKGIETFKELQQAINAFNGNFSENNIFRFKVKLNEDIDFINFAYNLKEFIDEDKINEYEKRVNERFSNIIRLIGKETAELNSKRGDIEKIIKKINEDFVSKNFVEAIKEMEMRTLESSNPVVKLLIKIQEFNDENSMDLGGTNLFTTPDSTNKNSKAVVLLKELLKAIEKDKNPIITLSESFDLQFRIVENDNDSGWVEKLSNVGSEGTDVLVKAMINILLLNVFKDNASKKFKDFKLHCMMDEIGRLHPNNVKGILRFANERNILLINGSPTSQNAIDYKYTYKLAKERSTTDSKKYITKINRLVKVTTKVLN